MFSMSQDELVCLDITISTFPIFEITLFNNEEVRESLLNIRIKINLTLELKKKKKQSNS